MSDSLAKYAAWHSRYGLGEVEGGGEGVRVERNVLASNLPIFRPHRYQTTQTRTNHWRSFHNHVGGPN